MLVNRSNQCPTLWYCQGIYSVFALAIAHFRSRNLAFLGVFEVLQTSQIAN